MSNSSSSSSVDTTTTPGSSLSPVTAGLIVLANMAAFAAVWLFFGRGGFGELVSWFREGGWMMYAITLVAMLQMAWNIIFGLLGLRHAVPPIVHLLPAAAAAALGVAGCALGVHEAAEAIAHAERDVWIPIWSMALAMAEIPREFGYVVASMGLVGMTVGPAMAAVSHGDKDTRLTAGVAAGVGALLGGAALLYALARGGVADALQAAQRSEQPLAGALVREVVTDEVQWIQIASLLVAVSLLIAVALGIRRPLFGVVTAGLVLGVVGADAWLESSRVSRVEVAMGALMPPLPSGFELAKSTSTELSKMDVPWLVYQHGKLRVGDEDVPGVFTDEGLKMLRERIPFEAEAQEIPGIIRAPLCSGAWSEVALALSASEDLQKVTRLLAWLRKAGACRMKLVVSVIGGPSGGSGQPPEHSPEHPLEMLVAADQARLNGIPFRIPRRARGSFDDSRRLELTLTLDGERMVLSGAGGDLPPLEPKEGKPNLEALRAKALDIHGVFPDESTLYVITEKGNLQSLVQILDVLRAEGKGDTASPLFDDVVWGDKSSVHASLGRSEAKLGQGGGGGVGIVGESTPNTTPVVR